MGVAAANRPGRRPERKARGWDSLVGS